MPGKVFISYSSRDIEAAQALCSALEAAGIACWYAHRDILEGQVWSEAIIDGINASAALLLIYSSASNASPQVLREVERAVSKRLGMVAVRLEATPLSKSLEYLLSVIHWQDASSAALEHYLPALVHNMQELLAARERGEEAAPSSQPSPQSASTPALPPNNLPRELTSFVGREQELREVHALLQNAPLLTLLGTGGVGKSRLAIRTATEVLPGYPDGVWLVELAALSHPSLVAGQMAQILGVKESSGQTLEQAVALAMEAAAQ